MLILVVGGKNKMNKSDKIKSLVKEKYSQIVTGADQSCCSSSSCCGGDNFDYTIMSESYSHKDGYVSEADLNLGCGIPTDFADIKEGNVVVDLGSGAGNDVFIARSLVGGEGKVIGVDMTEAMIKKAEMNKIKLNYDNVEFKLGDIENIPLKDNLVDVVVSNCVLNLVPDKRRAFNEIYRILNSKGHFCVSDIVLKGTLPEELRESAEMYAGCVAGALQQEDYLLAISDAGFKNIEIKKSKEIELPEEILKKIMNKSELQNFKESGIGIFSITVVGYK